VSKTSEVSITYSATGDGMTLTFTSTTQENAASPGEHLPIALASGDNTITVPTGARGVLIVPGATSTVVKKIKGVGGDTGVTIAPAYATYIALPTGAANFILNAASIETLDLYWA
jgi:hypothetical protein